MSTPRRLAPRSIGTPMILIFSGIGYFSANPWTAERPIQSRSRINAIEHPWEGDDLTNVFSPANPGDSAFQPKAKTGVRHAAVAAQVEIPLKRLLGQIVFAKTLDESFVTGEALTA